MSTNISDICLEKSISIKDNHLDVNYIENFINEENSKILFERFIKDSTYPNKRSKKIYGDQNKKYIVNFRGNIVEYPILAWDPLLFDIKIYLENTFNIFLTVCVVSIYPNSKICIKPHKDKEMIPGTKIIGISLGDSRILRMSNHSNKYDIELKNGSMYVFNPPTNDHWSHEILQGNQDNNKSRICLTFRNY
uniref:Alpha-ketoglutarate-dependent dioxygenase AlkB-like domain-containing protein n=1 Tax=viral metagenome TaxID=1070528 RepID=A0A6C0AFS1_9ZZZZ